MDIFTHFVKKWEKSYVGKMEEAWLDTVLPASVMLVDPLGEYLYVKYGHLNDEDFFAKFTSIYGVDLLHIWAAYYHWATASHGQPTFGELRDFAEKYERMVHDSIIEMEHRDAAIAISKMNHTPITTEIDECLEMVGMQNKVRGFLLNTLE